MALPSSTFEIAPSVYDGMQRLSDPLGTIDPSPPVDPPVDPPIDPPTLVAPTNFRITDNQTDSQELAWDHDGTNVDTFRVLVSISGVDTDWRELGIVGSTVRTISSPNLPNGTLIHYLIASRLNDGSVSSWVALNVTTVLVDPPVDPPTLVAPTNFRITDNQTDSQELAWDHSGTNVDTFRILIIISGVDPDWRELGIVGSTVRTISSPSLPEDTLIYYAISSQLDSGGVSNWVALEGTTLAIGPPVDPPIDPPTLVAPTNFRITDNQTDSQELAWDHPGTNVDTFRVLVSISGVDTDWRLLGDVGSTGRTISSPSLPDDTLIYYLMAALQDNGSVSALVSLEGKTLSVAPPPVDPPTLVAPTNFRITDNQTDSQELAWDHDGTNVDTFRVVITISGVDPDWRLLGDVGSTVRTISSPSLPSNTLIYYLIASRLNDGSESSWVALQGTTELDPGEPVVIYPVTNLQVTQNTHNYQTITWSHAGVGIDGYAIDIIVAGQDSQWRAAGTTGPADKTWSSSGLPSETIIRHRVAAGMITGERSTWVEVDATTDQSPITGGDTDLTSLTFFYNFEHLSNGASIKAQNEGFGTCDNFTCDTGKSYAGSRSGHTWIDQNSADDASGWGEWGYGLKELPQPLEGCEVWWRKAMYWASNSSGANGNPYLKQFRLMRRKSSDFDVNRGSSEISLTSDFYMLGEVEFDPADVPGTGSSMWRFHEPKMPKGRWCMVECYTKLARTNGIQACWIDGVSCGRVIRPTMIAADDCVAWFYMGTYWNNGARKYEEQWYDQIAVAMDGPTKQGTINDKQYLSRDSDGDYWIGLDVDTRVLR